MLCLMPNDAGFTFMIGDHSVPVTKKNARLLADFLTEDAGNRVWAAKEPVVIGDWRLEAARDARFQHETDIPRRRVRLCCPVGKWHLVPEELTSVGEMFRVNLE